MNSTVIICEYNPFHNAHEYQIKKLKELHRETCAICIMSPNFVQRGAPALFDKYTRAKAAVLSGADAVLSMPFVFSVLSAQGFARAGIDIADSLGVDSLAFGAEDDDIILLSEIANVSLEKSFSDEIVDLCQAVPSLSLQRAGEEIIKKRLGKKASLVFNKPNNILALEYLKSLIITSSNIKPIVIKRTGEGYKSLNPSPLSSATYIRERISIGESLSGYVPTVCEKLYLDAIENGNIADSEKFETLLHSNILLKSREELEVFFGSSEIADRLLKNLDKYADFNQAVSKTVTPRITRTRIMRGAVSALFEIPHNAFMNTSPQYTQLLCTGEKGRDFLNKIRRKEHLPIITKNADYKKYEKNAEFSKQFAKEIEADRIWCLLRKKPSAPNTFLKKSPSAEK